MFFLMRRRPPRSTRTSTLFPYTTLFRSNKSPVVSTPVSSQFQAVSTVFDINPPYADPNATIAKYRWLYEQGARKASLIYTAADQTRSEAEVHRPQLEAAGIQVVQNQELQISTISVDSPARSLANSRSEERRVGKGRASTCKSRG